MCQDDVLRVIGWYRRRWLIEDFHKAQKTGCRLEETQLEDQAASIRLAAITALSAVRLLQLREKADDEETAAESAMKHFDPLWMEVVSRVAKHKDPSMLSVRQFYHTIAQKSGWPPRR